MKIIIRIDNALKTRVKTLEVEIKISVLIRSFKALKFGYQQKPPIYSKHGSLYTLILFLISKLQKQTQKLFRSSVETFCIQNSKHFKHTYRDFGRYHIHSVWSVYLSVHPF